MSHFRSPKSALIILLLAAASAAPALAGASLDIRPSECPNLIDRGTFGRFPVALVSDYDFVVSRVGVDVGSLELRRADGVGGSARPIIFRSQRNTPIGPLDRIQAGRPSATVRIDLPLIRTRQALGINCQYDALIAEAARRRCD